MNEQSSDPLELFFKQSQAELPPQLKARLLAIPQVAQVEPSFWDLRWIIPAFSLMPAVLWLLIAKVVPWVGSATAKLVSWTQGLVLPALPQPSITIIGFGLGIVLTAVSAALWFYWNAESRVTLAYGKHLTGHIPV